MKPANKRTLSINCSAGEAVTKQQLTCFVHQLIADAKRPQPLRTWKCDPNAKIGDNAYYTNGFSEGTLITLRSCTNSPCVEFTYTRRGKHIYTAVETNGNVECDTHLTALLNLVTRAVTMSDANKKHLTPQQGLSATHVGDMFRKVSADQIIDRVLRHPSMLSINVAEGSPEFARLETLIRAVVTYIQAVRPKETGLLLKGFALKSVTGDRRVCGHTMLSPMSDIANAHVELDDKYYGGLKPAEQVEKFVADIVVNMLIGI